MKGTTLQFGGGTYGTISSAAIHAGAVGKIGYRLSVGHDQNQQWRNPDALAFRSNKFNVHTEYALPSDAKLLVSGGFVDSNRFDGPIGETVTPATQPSLGYANVAYERTNLFLRGWWSGYWDTPRPQPIRFLRTSSVSRIGTEVLLSPLRVTPTILKHSMLLNSAPQTDSPMV